jgi:PHD/YefM family antitoxin component YafN of YafNO toxin-antitoxin module
MEFITDARGRQKAVVVPIKEWESLQRMKRKLEVLNGVADALEEVAAVRSGRQPKGQTLSEFLNEN